MKTIPFLILTTPLLIAACTSQRPWNTGEDSRISQATDINRAHTSDILAMAGTANNIISLGNDQSSGKPVAYQPDKNLVRLADSLLTAIDSYVTSIRDAQREDLVELKIQLARLRAATDTFRAAADSASAAFAPLRTLANDILRQYEFAAGDYDRIVRMDRRFDSPFFTRIGETVDDLNRSVK